MPHDEDVRWVRSRRCNSSQCVEVAVDVESVLMRDAKDPDGGRIAVSREAWTAFIDGIKSGEFNDR